MTVAALTRTLFNDGWLFAPHGIDAAADWDTLRAACAPVRIPHTWNATDGQDGGDDYRRGLGSYVKRFSARPADGALWLEFRGVNSSADVYLNGHHLARHDGGYSTFRVALTPALAPENTLAVVADNGANDLVYPQRADFTFYGGIYRDVYLISAPANHFRLDDHGGPALTVTPTLAGDRAHVALAAQVTGAGTVRFSISDGAASQLAAVAGGTAHATLTIENVRRWHGLRDPHRYTATAELLVAGEVVDSVALRFGCREFAVDPDRGFLLNGESYPLRGVSRHQDWEGVGNAITREMMRTDMALLQELGATTVRLAHYQHDQAFYELCDEAGIVVWAEIPKISEFLPRGRSNAVSQLTELIVQNRHHASIVCWGLSNEITIAGSSPELVPAHRELNELAHALDPTRLTVMANLMLVEPSDPLVHLPDVTSFNIYYGWYVGELTGNEEWLAGFRAESPKVVVGISEYGADANPRFQSAHPTRGDYSEQYQARYHEHMLDLIERSPFLWATHAWNLADFAADARNEGGMAGRNQKGLVTFDRSLKKDVFYLYKAAWSAEPFVHIAGRRYVDRAEDVTEVTVYSNQNEVTLVLDGQVLETRAGRRVFRFQVPLVGNHELLARSGELTDAITVRKVAEPNPDYVMPRGTIVNWFEEAELGGASGVYSLNDTVGDIRSTPQGAAILDQLLAQAVASRGSLVSGIKFPKAMMRLLEKQTLLALIEQFGGGVSREQLQALNAALNQIPKG